jgi:cell wall-associated NlpC family hydrolase
LISDADARERVCKVARTYLNTPYHNGGRLKGGGVDCATLLINVFAEAGEIEDFDPGPYSPQFFMHRGEPLYRNIVERFARQVEAPLPADVVLYWVGRQFAHGGIVLKWPRIIHAYKPSGRVCMAEGDNGEFADLKKHPRLFYRPKHWE